MEELLEPYLKDTNLGVPYWDWLKNSTFPELWENILSPIKEWDERNAASYMISKLDLEIWRRNGCQSSSKNYGDCALRINDTNALVTYASGQKISFKKIVNNAMEQSNFDRFADHLQVKIVID